MKCRQRSLSNFTSKKSFQNFLLKDQIYPFKIKEIKRSLKKFKKSMKSSPKKMIDSHIFKKNFYASIFDGNQPTDYSDINSQKNSYNCVWPHPPTNTRYQQHSHPRKRLNPVQSTGLAGNRRLRVQHLSFLKTIMCLCLNKIDTNH